MFASIGATNWIGGVLTANVRNTYKGLHIVGVSLPVKIPPNFGVKLGSIAQVGINTGTWTVQGNVAQAIGAGLQVRLLEPAGSAETGASIFISNVESIVGPASGVHTGHADGGQPYGSKITANVGSLVGVRADPTAPVTVFAPGADGRTVTNSLASARLGTGLRLGAMTDTGTPSTPQAACLPRSRLPDRDVGAKRGVGLVVRAVPAIDLDGLKAP